MNRVNSKCCGDCSKCVMLANGEVDMIPCMVDQVFQSIQRMERRLAQMGNTSVSIASINETEDSNENE